MSDTAASTTKTKLRKIGNSVGMIIPAEMLANVNLREGDEVHLRLTSEGMVISAYDPDFDEMLKDAQEFLRTHRNAFRELSQ